MLDCFQMMKYFLFFFVEFINVVIFYLEDYVFLDSKQEVSNFEVLIWLIYVQGVMILINSDIFNVEMIKNLLECILFSYGKVLYYFFDIISIDSNIEFIL